MWRFLVLLVLAGCVSDRPITLPNGAKGYAISCPGTRRDIGDCMNRAAEVCGGPYDVVTQDGSTIPVNVSQIGNTAVIGTAVKRTMIVQCKNPTE